MARGDGYPIYTQDYIESLGRCECNNEQKRPGIGGLHMVDDKPGVYSLVKCQVCKKVIDHKRYTR